MHSYILRIIIPFIIIAILINELKCRYNKGFSNTTWIDKIKCIIKGFFLTIWAPMSFITHACGCGRSLQTVPAPGADSTLLHLVKIGQVCVGSCRTRILGGGSCSIRTEVTLPTGHRGFLLTPGPLQTGLGGSTGLALGHGGKVLEIGERPSWTGVFRW